MSDWLTPDFDAIPPELRALPWLLWRAEPAEPKPDKVPYRVALPRVRASSTNPATWATFDDAREAYAALAGDLDPEHPEHGPIAGVGDVLTPEANITCIDLDRVIGPDGLDPRAQTIIEHCDSWTEISPSGTGLHVWVRGRVPRALVGERIEVYSMARYIAVTGHRWPGTPELLRDQQPYLDHLTRRYDEATRPFSPRRPYTGHAAPPPDDLAGALLAKLGRWGVDVARLKRWSDGYLVELVRCPWADEHTSGPGGAAVAIHASGAFDFRCQHAHCARRRWADFRAAMEQS